MKLSDIFIIYLSCGAPFGVYFFLHNRTKLNSAALWLNSFLTTIVWFPYAFQFLHGFVTKRFGEYRFANRTKSDSFQKQRIEEIEKEFSNILYQTNTDISLFDFRETIKRYVGLTIADQISTQSSEIGNNEKELFRVTNDKNVEISAKCLNRRNRSKLKFHQTLAREDFLRLFNKLNSCLHQPEKFRRLAIEFVKLLKDVEAQNVLHKIFEKSLQIDNVLIVNKVENDVWKSKQKQPVPAKKIPLNLPALSATASAMNTRQKD